MEGGYNLSSANLGGPSCCFGAMPLYIIFDSVAHLHLNSWSQVAKARHTSTHTDRYTLQVNEPFVGRVVHPSRLDCALFLVFDPIKMLENAKRRNNKGTSSTGCKYCLRSTSSWLREPRSDVLRQTFNNLLYDCAPKANVLQVLQ